MRRIRLVIADRRPIVLQGFASLLAAERDFEVVASCLNGASCLEAIRNLTPDVVLVEDEFSDVPASEMLAIANAENLPSRLVFYTASVARGDVADAIATGACNAISMRAQPETVLKSLRLVAPRPDRVSASKAENGGIGADVLAALTDEERKIMRLVAYGLSNKEIARQLNSSAGAIKAQLDQICQKLQIGNRTGLATFALSRLSGGIGVLAALIFAALDDAHGADHALADTVTITADDGTTEVATIVIAPRKPAGASGTAAKDTIKAGRIDSPGKSTPTLAGKLLDSSVDITSSTTPPAALNAARPSMSSSSAFMMVAAGAFIYELDLMCRPAQAFDFGNSLTEVSTSATANGTSGSVTSDIARVANANFDGFDALAWLTPGMSDQSFVFDIPRSDIVALHGEELAIVGADAREAGASHHAGSASEAANRSDTIDEGSGTVSSLAGHSTDHGGAGETTEADTSQVGQGTTISSAEDPTRGQSQRDLHASEKGSAADKPDAKHSASGNDSNHGQSQRDLLDKQAAKHDASGNDSNHGQSKHNSHAAENGSAADKQDAKHNASGDNSNHGQSQHDLRASEDSSAAAEQHASKHAIPASDYSPGQSQRSLHAQPVNASGNPHSESSPTDGGKDRATEVGQAETATAPGDSFHFKNEMADGKDSKVHVDHRPALTEHGPAGHDGATPTQVADLIDLPLAEQHTGDHATGAEHHLAHFFIV